MDKNGTIKSMEYRDMFANKTYMGALQENILAQKVRALGYELDINRSKDIDKKAAELRMKSPCMSEKDLKDLRRLAEKTTRARKEHNPAAKN